VGAWKAVQDFLSILKLVPASLPVDHIGLGLPIQEADLPALVVAISEVKEMSTGLGGLVSLEKIAADQWKETRGSRSSGLMRIEIWDSTAEKIMELTNAVFAHLDASEAQVKSAGFLKFTTQEVRPIEEVKLGVSESKALRTAIGISIVYEEIKSSTTKPGGIIKEINVGIRGQFVESMNIHKQSLR
jgi:hypothetical protein